MNIRKESCLRVVKLALLLCVGSIAFPLAVAICTASAAEAMLKGDIELLKLVAMAHKDNSERIHTWQGKARVQAVFEDADGVMRQRKHSVDFLFDREQDATRWKWSTEEFLARLSTTGQLVSDNRQLGTIDAMIKGDAFFRYAPGLTTAEGERRNTLVIWPAEKARKRAYNDSFDPMWYFTRNGYDLPEVLMFHYREAHNPELIPGTVRREGDLVILETEGGGVLNRHVFDLSKGGNLVRYHGESPGITEQRDWIYEQKDGVWVPKTFAMNVARQSGGKLVENNKREVTFIENTLNHPIDPAEFTLERLGVQVGDRVTDQKMGVFYFYGGHKTFPLEDEDAFLREPQPVAAQPSVEDATDRETSESTDTRLSDGNVPRQAKSPPLASVDEHQAEQSKGLYNYLVPVLLVILIVLAATCLNLLQKSRKRST